ncbi:unnamed protein product [Boreogadus saida]
MASRSGPWSDETREGQNKGLLQGVLFTPHFLSGLVGVDTCSSIRQAVIAKSLFTGRGGILHQSEIAGGGSCVALGDSGGGLPRWQSTTLFLLQANTRAVRQAGRGEVY